MAILILVLLQLLAVLALGWYGTLRPCGMLESRLADRAVDPVTIRATLTGRAELACLRASYKLSVRPSFEDPATLFK